MARKKPPRPYQQHRLTGVLRRAAGGVNRRAMPFAAAAEWGRAVAEQLGGPLTATQRTRLHLAEWKVARLSAAYQWLGPQLVGQGGLALINAKRRQPYQLSDYLDRAEDSLMRLVASLESTAKPAPQVPQLEAYLAKKYAPKRVRRTKASGAPTNGEPLGAGPQVPEAETPAAETTPTHEEPTP
jgi:hypothetical protein